VCSASNWWVLVACALDLDCANGYICLRPRLHLTELRWSPPSPSGRMKTGRKGERGRGRSSGVRTITKPAHRPLSYKRTRSANAALALAREPSPFRTPPLWSSGYRTRGSQSHFWLRQRRSELYTLFKDFRYLFSAVLAPHRPPPLPYVRFTDKPKAGLIFLQKAGALPTPVTPAAAATFLRIAPNLSRESVGSFLGELGREEPGHEVTEYVMTLEGNTLILIPLHS